MRNGRSSVTGDGVDLADGHGAERERVDTGADAREITDHDDVRVLGREILPRHALHVGDGDGSNLLRACSAQRGEREIPVGEIGHLAGDLRGGLEVTGQRECDVRLRARAPRR